MCISQLTLTLFLVLVVSLLSDLGVPPPLGTARPHSLLPNRRLMPSSLSTMAFISAWRPTRRTCSLINSLLRLLTDRPSSTDNIEEANKDYDSDMESGSESEKTGGGVKYSHSERAAAVTLPPAPRVDFLPQELSRGAAKRLGEKD